MTKKLLCLCAFLAVVSSGICAEPATTAKGLCRIDCQIIPSTPLSKSELAFGSLPKMHPKMQSTSSQTRSLNWSGYAAYTTATDPEIGSVTDVWGNWTVPKLHSSQETRYAACWVGIDGYFNQTVEQVGTLHQMTGGHQRNFAWFSMYPGPVYELVGFPVAPKDEMRALVSYKGCNIFEMTLENLTQGVYTVIPQFLTIRMDTQRTSAEWIVEAPSEDTVLPLAHFSPVTFSHCLASIRGNAQPINGSHRNYSKIVMVESSKKDADVKAKPSDLLDDGKKFTVNFYHQ